MSGPLGSGQCGGAKISGMGNLRFRLVVALLLLATCLVAQTPPGETRLPPEYFEKPERASWQKPDLVVKALKLK